MMRTVTGAEVIAAGTAAWQIGVPARQGAGPGLIRRKTLATSRLFHRRLAAVAA